MRLSRLWKSAKVSSAQEPQVPDGQRVYAIGDVHGCRAHLAGLLDRIGQDSARKGAAEISLVYLGDYIDRGPQSSEVIELVLRVPIWADHVVRLKGNHEEMLERFLADPGYGSAWRQFGGLATLASYGVDTRAIQLGREYERAARDLERAMPATHHNFVSSLPYAHTIGDYFFCHAGVRPGVALEEQRNSDLCWIRYEFLSSAEDFGRVVVHGHSPVESPEVLANRVNVDTGAYATGVLSCAVIESTRVDFISVHTSDVSSY
jgi:serine/threonine protein phosphatase 1